MVNTASCHGLDADSINNWVDGTHVSGGPEGDIIPFVTNPDTSRPVSGPDGTNMTETVSANVDPCITPFGTTTLVAGCESLQKESIGKSTSTFPAVSNMVTGIWNMVTGRGGTSHIVREDLHVLVTFRCHRHQHNYHHHHYHHGHYHHHHHRVFVRRPGFRSKFRRTELMRI
jgi:hypothetical protein